MQRTWRFPTSAVFLALGAVAVTLTEGLYASVTQVTVTMLVAALALWRARGLRIAIWEGVALSGLMVGALLSLARPAVMDQAVQGVMLVIGWVLAFWLGRNLSEYNRAVRTLGQFWCLSTSIIVFGGAVAFSWLPPHHSQRFAGLLGYPVAVGLLSLLGLVSALPELSRGGRVYRVPAVLGSAALILSGSRGVLAVAVLLLAYLYWVAPQLLRSAFIPVLLGATAGLWATPAVATGKGWGVLLPLLLASLTSLAYDSFHYRIGRSERFVRNLALAVGAGLLILAPGWRWLLGRAVLVEGSSVERFSLLKDGLAMALSHPLGAGYRGWAAMHLSQASYGYYVTEVHSAPLDMAIAFGWIGAASFVLLVGSLLRRLPRRTRPGTVMLSDQGVRGAVFGGVAALALHGLLDWTLSYGLFMMPLFYGMGLLRSDSEEQLRPPASGTAPVLWRVPSWGARLLATTTLVVGLPFLSGTMALTLGEAALDRARTVDESGQSQRLELQQAERHLRMSVMIWPIGDRAYGELAQVYRLQGDRTRALDSVERAQRLAPFNPWYRALQGRILAESGRFAEAAEAYREYVYLQPWQGDAYAAALGAHVDFMVQTVFSQDTSQAEVIRGSARDLLALLEQQQAREPNVPPGRRLRADHPAITQAQQWFQ